MVELLPCPFCGGNDAFVEQSTFASSYVLCNDCMARGPDSTQESDDEEEPGRDAAIAAWNTRATSTPSAAVGEWVLVPREVLERRSVPTMDPVWSAAFNAALDMVSLAVDPVDPVDPVAGKWRDIASAPRDGTILELVVDYTDGSGPLQDGILACTIGWNSLDDTGEDEWQFAGWDWCQDYICRGSGKVVAWRPSRLNATADAIGPLPASPTPDRAKEMDRG